MSVGSLKNFYTSTFRLKCYKKLDFTVEEADEDLQNVGYFDISAPSINFNSAQDVNNNDYVAIRADRKGKFQFKNIISLGRFLVHSASLSDSLTLESLTNEGYFSYHRGACPEQGKPVDIKGPIENSGVIEMFAEGGAVEVIQGGNIHNDGLVCFRHAHLPQTAGVTGTGCWVLTENSFISIDATQEFSGGQSIVFGDRTAYIQIEKFGTSEEVIDIHGFMRSKIAIRSSTNIADVKYDPSTGNLKVFGSPDTFVIFNIEKGFEDRFECKSGVIYYHGKLPQEKPIPLTCACSNLKAPYSKRDFSDFLPRVSLLSVFPKGSGIGALSPTVSEPHSDQDKASNSPSSNHTAGAASKAVNWFTVLFFVFGMSLLA